MAMKPAGGMAILMGIKKKGSGGPGAMMAKKMDTEDGSSGPGPGDSSSSDDSSSGGDGYSIAMPQGFKAPEGIEPGQEFDATVKMHVDDNGMLCIDEVQGVPTHPGGESAPSDESDEGPPDEGDEDDSSPPPKSGPAFAKGGELGGMANEEGEGESVRLNMKPKKTMDFKSGLDEAIRKMKMERK